MRYAKNSRQGDNLLTIFIKEGDDELHQVLSELNARHSLGNTHEVSCMHARGKASKHVFQYVHVTLHIVYKLHGGGYMT